MNLFIDAINNLPDDIIRVKYDGHEPENKRRRKVTSVTLYDRTVDLHGFSRRSALSELRKVLSDSRGKRLKILVITGKGNNSCDGYGVIRNAVLRFLEKAGSLYVRDYGFASKKNGGDGAIEIFTK